MKRSMIVNLAFIKFVKGFARFPFRCVFHSFQQSRLRSCTLNFVR